MKYSGKYKLTELFLRLVPKPSEPAYEAKMKRLSGKPEKKERPPRSMGFRRETGSHGTLFYANEGTDRPYTIFYCHGGSYIHGFTSFHWRFLKKLMSRTGAAVVAAGYRLAPHGTWADAFELILPAYVRYAREHPDRKLILMGDSAGGGLAAALALELLRRGERTPDELILMSPWTDVTTSDPDIQFFVPQDPWLIVELRVCGRWWAGSADVRDPRVSPLFGPVEGLRHVTVFAGTREILNPDSVKFYAKLDPAGDNELVIGEGMFHVYPLLPIPEAKAAQDRIVEKIVRPREAPHGGV